MIVISVLIFAASLMSTKIFYFNGATVAFKRDTDFEDCYYMYVDDTKGKVYKAPILIEEFELESIFKKMSDFKYKIKDKEIGYDYLCMASVGAIQLSKKWG